MTIALKIYASDACTTWDWEITHNRDEGFRVWVSFGPLRGRYVHKGYLDTFEEALAALSECISNGELFFQDRDILETK